MNPTEVLQSLAGGALIGAAAAGLLLFNGRIAGISGMLRGLFGGTGDRLAGSALFLAGLVAGAAVWEAISGTYPEPRPSLSWATLAVAGLMVGAGTSLAKGCTSGHGVCGLATLSRRSLVAVGIFLSVAMATTHVMRHIVQQV